jgi:uncharacterized membrane protein SirB2
VFYLSLKTLHIACAVTSYALFFLRGLLRLRNQSQPRWLKVMPHGIDTVLLGSAIALTLTIGEYPLINKWLTIKLGALLLYIGLGMFALKYAQRPATRLTSWVAAQFVFAFIVLTALQHRTIAL